MGIQRPGDLYWLYVTYTDGSVVPFSVDAVDDETALYEAEYVLSTHHAHSAKQPVSGALHRRSGEVVAEVKP